MIIRKECLGLQISKKTPNGCHFNLTINNDPENFRLYQVLGLDVFEKEVPKKVEFEDKPKKKKDGGHNADKE